MNGPIIRSIYWGLLTEADFNNNRQFVKISMELFKVVKVDSFEIINEVDFS